jgi:hypothetical protein
MPSSTAANAVVDPSVPTTIEPIAGSLSRDRGHHEHVKDP